MPSRVTCGCRSVHHEDLVLLDLESEYHTTRQMTGASLTFLVCCLPAFCIFCEAADGDVPYRPTAEAADAGQVEEDEDDDAIAARRARIRERLRARPTEEAEVLEVEQEDVAK